MPHKPGGNHGFDPGNPLGSALEATAFLESLLPAGPRTPNIRAQRPQQAIRQLLDRVGNPQKSLRVIHIAGSKGKGSTALLAEAVLRAAGCRTGTFTSPHLQRWTERLRVDGKEASRAQFTHAVEQLRPHVQHLRAANPDNPPSFFDVLTAAALLTFRDAASEVAIIETGLGGRLDATNVVESQVSCITSIELEHTDRLGNTLEAIAQHKAGIIKPGAAVVVGDLPPLAANQVLNRAKAIGAPVARLFHEIQLNIEDRGLSGFELELELGDLKLTRIGLPLLGKSIAHDGALAAACVYLLDIIDTRELAVAIKRGFSRVSLPGRLELLRRQPWILVDCAHTESSAQMLASALTHVPARRTELVLSVSSGKNLMAICKALLADFDTVTATVAEPNRSLAAQTLAMAIRDNHPGINLRQVPDPIAAIKDAYERLGRDDLLCATGSVYMAGSARATLLPLIRA